MFRLDHYQIVFVLNASLVQLLLIIHFALRKWRFNLAIRYGWIVYAMSIPAAILSLYLFRGGMQWSFWLGGFIFLVWALYGCSVEYILGIEWRNAMRWSILVPYVVLYLGTLMFYWWPLALLFKPFWYVSAVLFLINTYLNVTSHKRVEQFVPLAEGR